MMKVVASTGKEDVAIVYIVEFGEGQLLECVEAVSPPLPREKKWVLLVSTMFGCPVGCMMCDAGGYYHGKTTAQMIFDQLDFLIYKRFPDGQVPARQLKIQFARMGEPALNPNVLTVLEQLPERYNAPGLMPSISTIAPRGANKFFERLIEIKSEKYTGGNFQFQFSLHTTDPGLRDKIIPVKKWSFREMADYGERFFSAGDRKITLNFALAQNLTVDPAILLEHFTPEQYLIKITPLNPTYKASANRLASYIDPRQGTGHYPVIEALREAGYEVILSIGEVEENFIGSNCGQFLQRHLEAEERLGGGYTYGVEAYEGGSDWGRGQIRG
jgi:23S rRNA (adenine2503-C2)-methyltransferase